MAAVPTDRYRNVVAADYLAAKIAHRAYWRHLSSCNDCEWDLCPVGKELSTAADELGRALPWNAAQIVRRVEQRADDEDTRVSRWGLVAAFVLGLLLMCAWPLYLAYWR